MKLNAEDLRNMPLIDSEGEKLGKIKDILFDDRQWKIRYLVVDTGNWLHDRLVLVMPDQVRLTREALDDGRIPCTLSKATIEGCPPLEASEPVSRRYETEMSSYYNTSPYWMGSTVWGVGDSAALVPPSPQEQAEHEEAIKDIEQCHVRSASEVEGYKVVASNDVSLGEVEQFGIDWQLGQIISIVAREGGLLSTVHERAIAPERVSEIDWHRRRVTLTTPWNDDDAEPSGAAPGTGLPTPTF